MVVFVSAHPLDHLSDKKNKYKFVNGQPLRVALCFLS